jgi:hypothetical protein
MENLIGFWRKFAHAVARVPHSGRSGYGLMDF